jgi:hypothetical protein
MVDRGGDRPRRNRRRGGRRHCGCHRNRHLLLQPCGLGRTARWLARRRNTPCCPR